jgi:hypothetical protein
LEYERFGTPIPHKEHYCSSNATMIRFHFHGELHKDHDVVNYRQGATKCYLRLNCRTVIAKKEVTSSIPIESQVQNSNITDTKERINKATNPHAEAKINIQDSKFRRAKFVLFHIYFHAPKRKVKNKETKSSHKPIFSGLYGLGLIL